MQRLMKRIVYRHDSRARVSYWQARLARAMLEQFAFDISYLTPLNKKTNILLRVCLISYQYRPIISVYREYIVAIYIGYLWPNYW